MLRRSSRKRKAPSSYSPVVAVKMLRRSPRKRTASSSCSPVVAAASRNKITSSAVISPVPTLTTSVPSHIPTILSTSATTDSFNSANMVSYPLYGPSTYAPVSVASSFGSVGAATSLTSLSQPAPIMLPQTIDCSTVQGSTNPGVNTGASCNKKKVIPKDNEGMHAELGLIAIKFFPRMCQHILQSIIHAKNLYRSFQTRSDLKIILVDEETSIIESMQTDEYKHFTVQLCYKILRLEQWLDTPGKNWGQMPTQADVNISDDIERIRFTFNRIVSMETNTLDEATYLNFTEDIKQIAQRVENYLQKPHMFCPHIQSMELMDQPAVEASLEAVRKLSVIEDNPYPSNPIQQGRTRYARLGLVVADTFPKMVREITRHNISADVMSRHISKQRRTNPSLLKKMTHEEHVRLNTLKLNKYDNIDFITIYKLLRAFSLIDDPSQGWGKEPTNVDVKISDDVERLRITRNKIVHRIKADIDILEMNYHFANLVNVTQRIDAYLGKPANQGFTKELQDFQTFCMDFEMEQKYFQTLKDIEDIKGIACKHTFDAIDPLLVSPVTSPFLPPVEYISSYQEINGIWGYKQQS